MLQEYISPFILFSLYLTVLLPLKKGYAAAFRQGSLNPQSSIAQFIPYFILSSRILGLIFLIYLGIMSVWWMPVVFFIIGSMLPTFLLCLVSENTANWIGVASFIIAPILLTCAFLSIH